MKFSRLALLACSAAPLVLALSLPADDLSFHPSANTEVAKTLKLDVEMRITEASATANGEPIPPEFLDSIKENSLIANMLIGVTEKYVETKGGKPITLLRTFDTMSLDVEFGEDSNANEDFKDPEGKTVEFQWDEKEGVYTKKYKDTEGDEAELADLDPDMDLRVLLPEKKVSAGDTWEVAASRLKPLFLPGGMITKGGGEDAGEFTKIRSELESQFSQFLKEFKVLCTYKGTKEVGGKTVAEIEFTFDGKMRIDMGSIIEEVLTSQAPEGMPEMDIKALFGMNLKGDGTMHWNIAAGHLAKFEMKADAGLDIDVEVHAQAADQPMDVIMTGKAEGKLEWELAPN
ncbi:MAG: hypothetical protein JNL28_04800 [Planctomycetes bacterium]|nr:hypothetical protein [Planctomycetota bacterium]